MNLLRKRAFLKFLHIHEDQADLNFHTLDGTSPGVIRLMVVSATRYRPSEDHRKLSDHMQGINGR